MSNVLAALFGGLGAGARSYGTDLTREQDQNRLAQQRMAELQQQERARIAQVQEAAALRNQERQQEAEQAAVIARAMGIDLPEGARLNTQGVQVLGQDAANKRMAAAQAGATERTGMTTDAAMQRLQAQIDANKGLNDARIQQLLASANAGNARAMEILARGQASAGQPPADTRRPMPASVGRELGEVGDVYALIKDASEKMQQPAAKDAVGLRYNIANILAPSALEGRAQSMMDSGRGNDIRASLGNLWSTIGKLRSGGAITDAEFRRLEPFLPSVSDDQVKAQKKLEGLEQSYRDIIERKLDIYGGTFQVPDADRVMGRPRSTAPTSSPPTQPSARPWENDAGFQAWKRQRGMN